MVGAARVVDGDGGGAHIVERLEPIGKEGACVLIALEVDAADLARAVIQVEISAQFIVFRLGSERTGRGASAPSSTASPKSASRPRAEVLRNIGTGAHKSLFLAGPERNSNGAA